MPHAPAASPAVWGRPWLAIAETVRHTAAIAAIEITKMRRDPTDIVVRSVQPTLWLVVFGQVFSRLRAIPTGSLSYLAFMAPGILAQSVLFTSIFYGIQVIWERDLGVLQKLLVSPARRSGLVLGKAVAAGVRGLAQGAVVIAVAVALGVEVRVSPLSLFGLAIVVILGAALFATFSLVIACLVKTRDRFMGIGQLLTMPLFFASNAIYPIDVMPNWLRAISRGNPLSYLVDALRTLMIPGAPSHFGLALDLGVLVGVLAALVALAARLYASVAR